MAERGRNSPEFWQESSALRFGALVAGLPLVDVDEFETYVLGAEDPHERFAIPGYWSPAILIGGKSAALIFAPIVTRRYASDFDAILAGAQADPTRGHLILPPLSEQYWLGPLHGDPLVALLSRPSLVHLAFLVGEPATLVAEMTPFGKRALREALLAFWS